jgi:hypothetical protein
VAIDALKENSEIVFLSGLNLYKSPKIVQKAMASKEASGPTPIIAVFDSKVEKQLGIIPYFHMKNADGFEGVNAQLAMLRGKEAEPMLTKLREPEKWQDVRGRSIVAAYVRSSEDSVTLRLSNGKLATLETSRLSEESQKRVAELAKE